MKCEQIRWSKAGNELVRSESVKIRESVKAKKLSNMFSQTQQNDLFTSSPSKENKKNVSAFQKGLVVDYTPKPLRVVYQDKTSSDIFNSRDQNLSSSITKESKLAVKRPSTAFSNGGSLSNRNPIVGQNMPDEGNQTSKKQVQFQPSKAYDLLNKRRYMMSSEMKPLSELQKTKKYQVAEQLMKSTVFANTTNDSSNDAQQKSRSRGQGLQKQNSMDAILAYKDSLPYRDEKIQSKVNGESYMEKQKQTLQKLIDQKMEPKMNKAKELKSDIGF